MESAIAFAEVLAPMLSERLGAAAPARAASGSRAGFSPVPKLPGGERGIADYIDEMLAQDRAASR